MNQTMERRSIQRTLKEPSEEGEIVLSVRGLSKQFGGYMAVSNLDLDVRAGQVLALLGPNGAGKSTVVGMMLGLIRPSSGQIVRHGLRRSRIGAIIENPAFYPFMSGRDNLRALVAVTGGAPKNRVDELLDLVGLKQAARRKYGGYSLGMKQRLGIASTLLADPKLIILDEPTNGLDPAGQQEVRALIPRLTHGGRAVIVTSHLLHDVEAVCDQVAILQGGRLRMSGSLDELLGDRSQIELRVGDPERAVAVLRRLPFVESVTVKADGLQVRAVHGSTAAISRALAEAGLFVEALVEKRESLEDIFFEVTSGKEK
jgi:ABC-2 type transport system ATP-binding protein